MYIMFAGEDEVAKFLDYSAHNGMRYHTEEDEENITVYSSQDVEPIIDEMKIQRGMPEDKKSNFRHYCSIPTWVEVELRSKGIDIWNKHQIGEVLKEINTNYPQLKATRMHHEIKG